MDMPFDPKQLAKHPILWPAEDEGIVFAPGDRLGPNGRFEISAITACSAVGIIYAARDTLMGDSPISLEVILPSLLADDAARRRLAEGVRAAQALAQPNIARTLDLGQHDAATFVISEYVEGRTLAEELAEHGPLPVDEALSLTRSLSDALAYAHKTAAHGAMHPDNVVRCPDGAVKLKGFATGRLLAPDVAARTAGTLGTAAYCAPEVLATGEATPASDLYSLGVLFYACVTGKAPSGLFKPPSQVQPNVPGWVDDAIASLLEEDPGTRGLPETLSGTTPPPKTSEPAKPTRRTEKKAAVQKPRASFTRWIAAAIAAAVLIPAAIIAFTFEENTGRPGEQRAFAGIEFVWIPPGVFEMGSAIDEPMHAMNETQHEVMLTKGFWMGTFEITQAQWAAVMGTTLENPELANRPAADVSWEDCQEFLRKLNEEGDGPFRLPTEAEWEYACRAGSTDLFCCGSDATLLAEYAWFVQSSNGYPADVGLKKPNAWGLHDMHGNVWEWCQDWYNPKYGSGKLVDPKGPEQGSKRVLRGGCVGNQASNCRSAARHAEPPDRRHNDVGFRLVRDP